MLKNLFTSKVRIKLLTLFLLEPEVEYYIRELTRKLDEQINSVRRELTNLKKLGLLRSRMRMRKKFYVVNKEFILFEDLRNIILKSMNSKEKVVKGLKKIGNIDFLLMTGIFTGMENDPVDLLIVGQVNRDELEHFLNQELETERPVKFSILSRDDFLYRMKCRDRFVFNLMRNKKNIVKVNRLEKEMAEIF